MAHFATDFQSIVEGLLSIPEIAYENRSGKPMPSPKAKPAQLKGAKWEEPDLTTRYPVLSTHFA